MLGECPQPWLIAQQVQTMQVESGFPQKFWMHMFHFSFSFWHHSWEVWFLVFWVKLFLSLERFEIKSFSLMSWWCALAWFVFYLLPRAFGSFHWSSDFSSRIFIHLLYGWHIPVHFLCSLCQRFCYSKAGPPGLHFSPSDFTMISLFCFLGTFVNYLC